MIMMYLDTLDLMKILKKILILINRSAEDKNISIDIKENTLEKIDIKYNSRRIFRAIYKEYDKFNLQINSKSFSIFNVVNHIEV